MVSKATNQGKGDKMKHKEYIEVDGFKLRYLTEGEGPDTLISCQEISGFSK